MVFADIDRGTPDGRVIEVHERVVEQNDLAPRIGALRLMPIEPLLERISNDFWRRS